MIFTPEKKKGGKNLVYFRFRSAKNATTPIMQAIATAASMASSMVMSGVSVLAAALGAASSGSIDCAGDRLSPTLM
jgi:hypothetical protein